MRGRLRLRLRLRMRVRVRVRVKARVRARVRVGSWVMRSSASHLSQQSVDCHLVGK